MKFNYCLILGLILTFSLSLNAQEKQKTKATYHGTVGSVEYVSPLAERPNDLLPPDNTVRKAKDKRNIAYENAIVPGKDPQTTDDIYVLNKNEMEQTKSADPPTLVFDAYSSVSSPTDPSLAIGPEHVFVVFNTGFAIYDKNGDVLVGQTAPNPAIFPSGGCCDLTVSYDNAADRWILSFLTFSSGAQVAVSDGPDPVNDGWYIYNIPQIDDYQKVSVWSDGYYMTDNTGGTQRVWAMERDAMLVGDPGAGIVSFDLPEISTDGIFYSPQALNVTDDNLPGPGGLPIVYQQDDAWSGVTEDHIKVWTIDVDWGTPANSTVSSPTEIPIAPFIGVFDGGSFSNLDQPGGGIDVDALQSTVMNQAQFRKFGSYNSAIFNFTVDTDAGLGELAGVRWVELRQSGDGMPWTLYQEGTYTAPDGRHAWCASMAMDGAGNIGMGYTSMSGPSTPSTVRVSTYYTGRLAGDPLGTMTVEEELVANGTQNIPDERYGDYGKVDVDPSDDQTFWFINEYKVGGSTFERQGVVGVFKIAGAGGGDSEPPTDPMDVVAFDITTTSAFVEWTASSDNVGVVQYNLSLDGVPTLVANSNLALFDDLTPNTTYTVCVSAQDAAGNISGEGCTTFTTLPDGGGDLEIIAAYYFEESAQGWTDPGSDSRRANTNKAFEGEYGIRLRDGSATSHSESPTLDLTGNSMVTVEIHSWARSMEPGEDYVVEFYNGTFYEVIAQYVSETDFTDITFFSPPHIELDAALYDFNANNKFRVTCNGSDNNDKIVFDQVIIRGDNPMLQVQEQEEEPQVQNALAMRSFAEETGEKVKIYPNPTKEMINIDLLGQEFDEIQVFAADGTVVYTWDAKSDRMSIDVTQYPKGLYFVRFVSNGLATTKRFVKQ